MELEPRIEAGVEGYLEEAPSVMDTKGPSRESLAIEAIRTREHQIKRDVRSDPDPDGFGDRPERYGYRSLAVIPVVHEGTVYGLLGLYTDRSNAFENQELDVIGQLGEVVGHAIAAIERKQALTSDEVIELEFLIPDVSDTLGLETTFEGQLTFDRAVPTGDGDYLEFGTVAVEAIDALKEATDRIPYFEEVRIDDREHESARFELHLSEPPVISAVASHGGYLREATLDDDEFQLTIHLPATVDARRIIDVVQDRYPTADLLRHRQVTREEETVAQMHPIVVENLTDRQQSALEAAYGAGFFEWPREATGEEVADSLGVAPPTFHQHLRKGQRRVFESLLSNRTSLTITAPSRSARDHLDTRWRRLSPGHPVRVCPLSSTCWPGYRAVRRPPAMFGTVRRDRPAPLIIVAVPPVITVGAD